MTASSKSADLDAVPEGPVDVVLALGTNLGDRGATLASAVGALGAVAGLEVRRVSPVVETDPVGGPEEQAEYLNAVLLAVTTLSPHALLDAAQAVEAAHGRERGVRWGPRTLDVDLLAYADLVAAGERLTLPHPRAHERAFVLVPWAAADPTAVLPGPTGRRVADLAASVGTGGVRRRPDVVLTVPSPAGGAP